MTESRMSRRQEFTIAMDDNINSIRQFLHEFKTVNIEENVKCRSNIISSYYLNPEDVKAEVLDWSMHYLEQKKCPYSLALILAKLVAHQLSDSIYEMSLQAEEGIDEDDKRFRYESSQLYTEMTECLSEAITNWQDDDDLSAVKVEPLPRIVSLFAMKNTRRKMEDRHVVIHDLNAVCGLKDSPKHSYYAIFDGHAGVEAASYCAAHLHWNITSHSEFLSNTEKAIFEAVILTDRNFLERSYREGIKGGCTALCCLIRDNVMYIAWVGDSQAVLVKQGTPVPVGLPHKPDREDERSRIEELGGCILFVGTWRVNGTLSVSRALGDAEHKPYISNEPDVLKIPLDGTEDYVVLACDGLWDHLQTSDIGEVVYNHIIENAENVDEVASKLVQLSKSQGSTDNITAIVVFLSDPLHISKPDQIFPQLQNKDNENHGQINETNPSDTLWNSEEIIHQTINPADFVTNGISTAEQLNNELNSLNFSQSKSEPSDFQEKVLTPETLIQQSRVSPTLLTYEEPLLHNYSSAFTNIQSTPKNLIYSVNSTVSHITNSLDCSDSISADAKQQENVNQNLIENISPLFINHSDSSIICTENIGTVESNPGNLLNGTIHICNTVVSEKKESTSTNDNIIPKEDIEPSDQPVIQSTTDLEIESTALLPELNKDNHLSKGREEAVFRNNSENLNLEVDGSSYYTASDMSSNDFSNIIGHTNETETTKINNFAISNAFQTKVEDLISDVSHSINVENSYQQITKSALVSNDELNLCTSKMDIVTNNNFHSSPEHLNTTVEKDEVVNSVDSLVCDKSTVLEGLSILDPAIDSLQTDKVSGGVLHDCLLDCKSEADSIKEITMEMESIKSTDFTCTEAINSCSRTIDVALNNNLQPETKIQESVCADVPFLENKQLKEGSTLSANFYEDLSLHSAGSPDFNKTEPVQELPSQNYSTIPVNGTNINLIPEMLNDNIDNASFLCCTDKTVSENPKVAPQVATESYAKTSDHEVNQNDDNTCISVNNPQIAPADIPDHSIHEKASLHTIDITEHACTDAYGSPQVITEQENKTSTNSCENIESLPLNLQNMICTEGPDSKEILDETLSKDDLSKEPKCSQENTNSVFESPGISNEASSLHTSSDSVPHTVAKKIHAKHTKELAKFTSNNKISAIKKTTTVESDLPSNIRNKKQIAQKPVKDIRIKPMQAQQPKIKQMITSKDKVECETATKSLVAIKPKSTQLSVFERLSTPKTAPTRPKQNRNREDLHSIKGTVKPISDNKTRNNFSQSNRELGAISKRVSTQSENAKTKSHSSTAGRIEINSKTYKPPLSTKINVSKTPLSDKLTVTKVSGRNLFQKTDHKLFRQPYTPDTRKSSNITKTDGMKNSNSFANKEEATKQRSPLSTKVAGKELLDTSTRQSTIFRYTASNRLDNKHSNTSFSLPSFNSKKLPVRSARIAMEKSSISGTTTKGGKTSVAKSISVQKKDSNATIKMEKNSHVQKASVSNHNLPSLGGQGDCINVNAEVIGKNIGQSKLSASESNEVPNHSLYE